MSLSAAETAMLTNSLTSASTNTIEAEKPGEGVEIFGKIFIAFKIAFLCWALASAIKKWHESKKALKNIVIFVLVFAILMVSNFLS